MKQIIHWTRVASQFNGTLWQSMHGIQGALSGATLEGARGTPWSVAGTLSNLKYTLTAPPGSGKSRTLTVFKNGSATSLAVTITDPATTATDTSNTVSVSPGDTLSVRHTNAGGLPDVANSAISLEFDSTADNESGYCASPHFLISSTADLYNGLCFGDIIGQPWPNDYRTDDLIPVSGALTRLDFAYRVTGLGATYAQLASGDSVTFVVLKNGVVQDGSGGTTNTTTTMTYPDVTASWTGSLTCVAGDVLKLRVTPSSGMIDSFSWPILYSCCFVADDDDVFWIGHNTYSGNTSTIRYGAITNGLSQQTTESNALGRGAVSTWYLTDLKARSSSGTDGYFKSTTRLNQATPSGAQSIICGVNLNITVSDVFSLYAVGTAVAPGGSNFITIAAGDSWGVLTEVAEFNSSLAFGLNTTVSAPLAIAFGVDGNTNVHDTAGVVKIFGDLEVTGTFVSGSGVSDDLDDLGT